jgi:hypothetical protein
VHAIFPIQSGPPFGPKGPGNGDLVKIRPFSRDLRAVRAHRTKQATGQRSACQQGAPPSTTLPGQRATAKTPCATFWQGRADPRRGEQCLRRAGGCRYICVDRYPSVNPPSPGPNPYRVYIYPTSGIYIGELPF